MNRLRLSDISARRGTRWVLKHVDLELNAGESLWLSGDNGAGKSTLLGIAAGLLRPQQGQVLRPEKKTALVAHHAQSYEDWTAEDHLGFDAALACVDTDIEKSLKRVELLGHRKKALRHYSAGMRKRLSLARTYALETQLYLLDEPFGQLDERGCALIESVVEEWLSADAAVLVASHQSLRAKKLCARHAHLDDGLVREHEA